MKLRWLIGYPGEIVDEAVLTALEDGPLHGYAIIKRVDAQSSGELKLRIAPLYVSIERLLREGLIRQTDRRDEDAPNRRYYELTGYRRRVPCCQSVRKPSLIRSLLGRPA